MVSVENVTVVSISTYEELKTIIQRGSEQRHTTGTLMNEQSSRSHLIVSVIIESTNLQTQAIARGKVDASLPFASCDNLNSCDLYDAHPRGFESACRQKIVILVTRFAFV